MEGVGGGGCPGTTAEEGVPAPCGHCVGLWTKPGPNGLPSEARDMLSLGGLRGGGRGGSGKGVWAPRTCPTSPRCTCASVAAWAAGVACYASEFLWICAFAVQHPRSRNSMACRRRHELHADCYPTPLGLGSTPSPPLLRPCAATERPRQNAPQPSEAAYTSQDSKSNPLSSGVSSCTVDVGHSLTAAAVWQVGPCYRRAA